MANALTKIKADALTADLIDETKLADDSIDSEHYNDGSIDHAHLANDAVDGDNIGDDAIGAEHIADNAVGLAAMAHGTDGQIITYDASGAPTAVGPGTDGQEQTSTRAVSPPAFETISPRDTLSFRNKIINGSFWVWQRGTGSFDTNDQFTADRWRMVESGGTGVVSRGTFTVGSEIAGSEYYLNYNVSTASDYTGLKYRIENVKSIEPGTWTISFWAKHTTNGPNGGLIIRGDQNFGAGGSAGVSLTSPAAITTSTSWTRYQKTVTIPSISGKTIGANSYLQLEIGQGSDATSTAWNLDIANVQFEKASTASDFEQIGYGNELARCERYYEVQRMNTGTGGYYAHSNAATGNTRYHNMSEFRCHKRASPTVTLVATANVNTPTLFPSSTHIGLYHQSGSFYLTCNHDTVVWTIDAEL